MSGVLKAYWFLSWAFLATVLTRWLRWGSRFGLQAFHRNYAADRLNAMRPGDAAVLVGAGRCIACGRCQRGDAALMASSAGAYPGLMTLVLSAARSSADAQAAAPGFRFLSVAELQRREQSCPQAVPIADLAQWVLFHAGPVHANPVPAEPAGAPVAKR